MKAKGLQKLLSCKVATCLGKCGNMLEHVIHAVKASPIIERERGICWKKMRSRKKSEVAMVLPDVSKAVPGRERLQVSSDVGRPLSSLNTDCPDMSRHKRMGTNDKCSFSYKIRTDLWTNSLRHEPQSLVRRAHTDPCSWPGI